MLLLWGHSFNLVPQSCLSSSFRLLRKVFSDAAFTLLCTHFRLYWVPFQLDGTVVGPLWWVYSGHWQEW